MYILIYYTASSAVSSHAHDTQLIIIWSESSWDSRRIAASSRLYVWNVRVHNSAEAQQYWLQYVVSRHSATTYQHIHRNYISKVIKTTFWSKCLHCVMMGCTNKLILANDNSTVVSTEERFMAYVHASQLRRWVMSAQRATTSGKNSSNVASGIWLHNMV